MAENSDQDQDCGCSMQISPAAWSFRAEEFNLPVYAINEAGTSIQDAQEAVVMEPASEVCGLLQYSLCESREKSQPYNLAGLIDQFLMS
jgi:hypothetical protein